MKKPPRILPVRVTVRHRAAPSSKSSLIAVLEDLKIIAESGYKFLLFAGILPIFGYLIASLHFYPSGVTIGDAFFFLMVALVFGFAYLLFVLFGFLVGQLPMLAWRKFASHPRALAAVGVVILLIALAGIWVWRDSKTAGLLASAVCGFTLSGICLASLIESLDRPALATSTRTWTGLLCAGVLFLPLILATSFVQKLNENVVMPKVGLRAVGVTLKLSEENYDILASAASGQHLAALGCKTTASGQAERLVHGVDLLWHGVGERSLVGIPSTGEPLIVELKREGVFVLRNYASSIERCMELSGDVLFEAGSSQLSADRSDLDEMVKIIRDNKERINGIQVIGHADALGYSGGAEKNNRLALERAEKIQTHINEELKFPKDFVKAVGHGAREPKTLCKDWPVKATLSECLAVNRRVEVRMTFIPVVAPVKDTKQDASK
jgi:OOP family OmpA-OmpF porin